jgi:diguanylate cyclase (GGDEF)-like protein/PAS domain S-box-containing protein
MNQHLLKHQVNKYQSSFALHAIPKPKILLVDDRQENLHALQRLLRSLDAELFSATCGTDALSLTLRHQFALILLDVQMPGMNGFEVAEFLHGHPDTRSIPIIFITAMSKEERYIAKGYEAGAVDYLSKPLDPDTLLTKVKVFLELNRKTLELEHALLILSELNHKHRLLVDCAGEGILGFDACGTITFANPMAETILAADGGKLQGHPLMYLFGYGNTSLNEWQTGEIFKACHSCNQLRNDDTILWKLDGSSFPAQYTVAPYDPEMGLQGGVMVIQDITVRKQAEQALIRLASFDSLTGLANRMLFINSLKEALSKARRHNKMFGIIFLDMDKFKDINDQLGHLAGDDVLKLFAQRLKDCVRTEDIVARFGGDEFAILVDDISEPSNIAAMVEKIICKTSLPVELNGQNMSVYTSAGIALYPDDGQTAEELLHAADTAMYEAKDKGRNGFCFHSPASFI